LLIAADSSLDVVVWPDQRCLNAEVAVCWDPPSGIFDQMPNLRLVHSIAAGIDNIVGGQNMRQLSLCRVVDPALAAGMLQFVLWGVVYFHRRLDEVLDRQLSRQWVRPSQTPASACRVGVMGMGELGGFVARYLLSLGYTVSGWSRTPREMQGVQIFSGPENLDAFLAQADILVCLLPLTPETRGILAQRAFDALPKGAALIHCGRGEHLVEADLITALDSGQLRGAIVDVFEQEPLHTDHPFWIRQDVVVTPHMATMATVDVIVEQVVTNIGRLCSASPLLNQVNLQRGY